MKDDKCREIKETQCKLLLCEWCTEFINLFSVSFTLTCFIVSGIIRREENKENILKGLKEWHNLPNGFALQFIS